MIQITIKERHPANPGDGLGRTHTGWSPDLSAAEVYEAARGCWKLGPRADGEKFALVVHDGIVRAVLEIDRIDDTTEPGRRAITGRVVGAGHPFHDRWAGLPAPGHLGRNPITYVDDTTVPAGH